MFGGIYTAIITPFNSDKKIDWTAFHRLVRAQIKAGVDGLVLAGITGESPTLTSEEYVELIASAARLARGKLKIIASADCNSLRDAICLSYQAKNAGAHAMLHVVPYYNRPTQDGLNRHFLALAHYTTLPVILYNNPERSGVEIAVETIVRMANFARPIIGLVESGRGLARVTALRAALRRKFLILSADDALTLPFLALGADGVMSVASNLIPRRICQIVRAAAAGNYAQARRWHDHCHPLFRALSLEPNPVPIKTALALTGQIEEQYRSPLCPMNPQNRDLLKSTLVRAGLLSP